jgi:excisionase family DNA binding protein
VSDLSPLLSALADELRATLRREVREALAEALRPVEYLRPEEAARVAKVQPSTILDWVEAGHLPRCGTPRHVLVRRADLDAYLTRQDPDGFHALVDKAVRRAG